MKKIKQLVFYNPNKDIKDYFVADVPILNGKFIINLFSYN